MATAPSRKILLIGWDAADWKFASPLLDAGKLPALAALVEGGVMGNIATLQPPLSPMLWTSIATGKLADKHGVLGFLESERLNAETGVRPVSARSRRVKALWNMLDQRSLEAHVIGWYATHPAEPLRGVSVSDRFFEPQSITSTEQWKPPVDSVAPDELTASLASLVVNPREMTVAQLREFIPSLEQIDPRTDERPFLLGQQLARAASVQAVATAVLQNEPWDFVAVYFDTIDTLGHHFMPYHPPRMNGVSERDFELYRRVMTSVYVFHDLMLARLLELAGPDATVLLVSDHGFHCDEQRPPVANTDRPIALDAAWHRPFGMICAAGPGLKRDERIYGASILDVTPTILTLFGLPVGEDMDGRVMADAFESPPQIARIVTWENATPAQVSAAMPDARRDRTVIDQFVALGYLQPLSPDAERNAARAESESEFALSVVYLSTGRAALALPLLEALHAKQPDDERAILQLAQCLHDTGRAADCAALLQTRSQERSHAPALRAVLLGSAMLALGRAAEAEQHFAEAEALAPNDPATIALRGDAFLALQKWEAAAAAFQRALAVDPDNAHAHNGLAVTHLQNRRFYEAAQAALDSVQRLHFFPAAHFHLGVALAGMGDHRRALQAFQTSLSMAPGHREAHRWIASLHNALGNSAAAQQHLHAANAPLT
ncbi:MAG: alkaline phosphatase family protein [Chthoniobacterales bacterium]